VLARSVERGRVEDRARQRLKLPSLVLDDEALDAIDALRAPANGNAIDLLGRLPVDQREAIRARIVEDRSYAEIAAGLQCSECVVRQRVSRGLAALRAQVEEAK
jgi:RNA polymerase sigma factor (sigma-70 family)